MAQSTNPNGEDYIAPGDSNPEVSPVSIAASPDVKQMLAEINDRVNALLVELGRRTIR